MTAPSLSVVPSAPTSLRLPTGGLRPRLTVAYRLPYRSALHRRVLHRLRQTLAARVVGLIQHFAPREVRVLGRSIVLTPQVFNPKYFETSEFLARNLGVQPGEEVLDVGTGSGIQAIVAAATASKVVATDINPEAVLCARDNCARNGVSLVSVLEGDLFGPVPLDARFDRVIFNPPYLEGTARSLFDRALYDPGNQLLNRFLKEAPSHLKPTGRVVLGYSSIADLPGLFGMLEAQGYEWRELARRATWSETYYVFELRGSRPQL